MNETFIVFKHRGKIIGQPIGFPSSICLHNKTRDASARARLLRRARLIPSALKNHNGPYIEPECIFNINRNKNSQLPKVSCDNHKSKILLFKNIFNSPDKEKNQWFSPGALYLSAALKKTGYEVILSDSKISLEKKEFITEKDKLDEILRENPDLNFIGISLCEDFFEKFKELVRFLRMKTKAFIGVGGVMPTLTPEHVFVHSPEVSFLVRGAGEEIFPRIVKILEEGNIDSYLSYPQINNLLKLQGFLFHNKHVFISAALDKVNILKNYDRSRLDFSFLKKENLTEGLNLFTSRGCFNNCFFCTSPGKGRYVGKSFQNLKIILRDYNKRLKEIFADGVPAPALNLSFNDDDFLADVERAKSFLSFLRRQSFRINFFQTGINSFFQKGKCQYTDIINQGLLRRLSAAVFLSSRRNIYIGTENFCDSELKRLNKGYDFSKIERVVEVLSKKKIYQIHHLIASNQLTAPEDILDNLVKISTFQVLYGDYFSILVPVIPYLVSLYPSLSYRISLMNKREKFLNIKNYLRIKDYPEYDYPFVKNDIPINKITREIIPIIYKLFLNENDYLAIFDLTLVHLLLLQERIPSQKNGIRLLIKKYKNYPEIIFKKTNHRINDDRNNLQLMITKRCQLRCRYCPIVKKNLDMDEEVLYKAIDLLFTSTRDTLRLDFTGGEPLLRFDLVEKGVEYARKMSKKKNKAISFYLITNLIALNDKMADFLAGENFFLELSLDGEEEFHNFYKISASPKLNPYRLTVSQLRKVFLRKINNYAVMVVTPYTVNYLSRNFCHLLRLGFRQIGINYAFGSIWEKGKQEEFLRQLNLIKNNFYPYIERGIIKLSNLNSRIEPAILNNEIMVDVDGRVYYLTDWLFEKETKKAIPPVGQIDDFRNLNDILVTKFCALNRLFEHYPSPRIKSIIVNNIDMGNSVKEYFERWKKK